MTTTSSSGQAELEAARLLLERMGITPDQLLHTVVTPSEGGADIRRIHSGS